jgi:hypothetical protein
MAANCGRTGVAAGLLNIEPLLQVLRFTAANAPTERVRFN